MQTKLAVFLSVLVRLWEVWEVDAAIFLALFDSKPYTAKEMKNSQLVHRRKRGRGGEGEKREKVRRTMIKAEKCPG